MSMDDRPPDRDHFIAHSLISLPICPSLGTCSICKEPFEKNHVPVRLKPCGHIFGRECILSWFDSDLENANTCPMDRTILFKDEYPHNALVAFSLPIRARRDVIVTLIQGGQVIGINGQLTRGGCRRVVVDLWHHTGHLLKQAEGEDLDALSIDEVVLGQPIRYAIPVGVEVGERAWRRLVSIAREMLVRHIEGSGLSEILARGELWRYTEELERACNGMVDG